MSANNGLCECGCGAVTPIARQTSTRNGTVKGAHNRYIKGHSRYRPVDRWNVDEHGCWIWAKKTKRGYGKSESNGRTVSAHRMVWEERHGIVLPSELHLDHLCRVTLCVNPDHMELVTAAGNQRRSSNAKLTAEKAQQIRESAEPVSDLARRFGVSRGTIWDVQNGRKWLPDDLTLVNRYKAMAAAVATLPEGEATT